MESDHSRFATGDFRDFHKWGKYKAFSRDVLQEIGVLQDIAMRRADEAAYSGVKTPQADVAFYVYKWPPTENRCWGKLQLPRAHVDAGSLEMLISFPQFGRVNTSYLSTYSSS